MLGIVNSNKVMICNPPSAKVTDIRSILALSEQIGKSTSSWVHLWCLRHRHEALATAKSIG
ncbi:hypothetical protein O9993_06785 [Vibrio lentus]|nr:hypothetical protein [Vibrio lentus]